MQAQPTEDQPITAINVTPFEDLSRGAEAVIVADGSRPVGVLTRADLLEFLAHSAR